VLRSFVRVLRSLPNIRDVTVTLCLSHGAPEYKNVYFVGYVQAAVAEGESNSFRLHFRDTQAPPVRLSMERSEVSLSVAPPVGDIDLVTFLTLPPWLPWMFITSVSLRCVLAHPATLISMENMVCLCSLRMCGVVLILNPDQERPWAAIWDALMDLHLLVHLDVEGCERYTLRDGSEMQPELPPDSSIGRTDTDALDSLRRMVAFRAASSAGSPG
jgi:hypothetical protein